MAEGEIERLPPELQAALQAEIDPEEELRWCGRPDAGRASRRLMSGVVLFALIAMLFGGMALFAAWSTRAELIGGDMSSHRRGDAVPTWGAVWLMGLLGTAIFSAGAVGGPLFLVSIHRAATRTVYALTDTRVFSVVLNRRGLARISSMEPGHPLFINRSEGRNGRGDIHLYPGRGQQGAAMSLIGVERPRDVERLIRSTFDPPGAPRRPLQ